MNKRIFVTANGNSVFSYQYIMKMCSENYDIVLLDLAINEERWEYYEYYKSRCITIVHYPYEMKGMMQYLVVVLKIKDMGNFDVCHIMYVTNEVCRIVQMCRQNFKQIITNFWGSDFYRTTEQEQQIQKKLLDISDIIILPTETMEKPFIERWKDLAERVITVEFESYIYLKLISGSSFLEADTQYDILRKMKDKIVIVAGHSGNAKDQHEMMIAAIDQCDLSVKSQIIVILPMTYGLTVEYQHKINDLLKKASFESIVLTEFMTDDQVCMLRERTDVFIQAITTDAFSGAMEENLYSQSVILCGDWLNYPQLHEEANSVIWYSDEGDLSGKISMVVNDIDEYKKKAVGNRTCIERIKAKRKNVMNWSDFYTARHTQAIGGSDMQPPEENIDSWMDIIMKIQKADTRRNLYSDIMNEWLKKQIQSEAPIRSYIEENHFKNVLIYGGGTLGELVYTEISNECEITVCDQSGGKRMWYEKAIKTPDMIENNVFDCIIITPIHIVSEIKEILVKKQINADQVISVSEIINRKERVV